MISDAGTGRVPEQIHVVRDEASGLEGVIALHSLALGPAMGGCRVMDYADPDEAAAEACRLAEAMSYTHAVAGLPLGGGAAIVRLPARNLSRPALFAAFGRTVRSLGGSYVATAELGTTAADMSALAQNTRVAVAPQPDGAASWATARSTFVAMRSAVRRRLGRELSGCTVAIQGVGAVGAALAQMLHEAGARLTIADVDSAAVARVAVAFGAEIAPAGGIMAVKADIFAPCAAGGVLNSRTIARLAAPVVCGGASGQLREPRDAEWLAERNILYAPDFVVNAGGAIHLAAAYLHWPSDGARERIEQTPLRLEAILDAAQRGERSTHAAAETAARRAIAASRSAGRVAA